MTKRGHRSERTARPLARRRNRRRGQAAQAVLEMAFVMIIMMAIIFNFLGIMVEVKTQTELQTAVSLAAQASLAAKVHEANVSCIFAGRTFYSTIYASSTFANGWTPPGCPGVNGTSWTYGAVGPPGGTSQPFVLGAVACTGAPAAGSNYYSGAGYPLAATAGVANPVRCSATLSFNFSNSPLAPMIAWTPTFTATGFATPPLNRQCAGNNPTIC